jgi:hypothetical protein
VARMGAGRNVYRVLVGKPEGKRPLERPRSRWEDGIKLDLTETGWGRGVDSSRSGEGQLMGCCECGDEPSGSGATELVTLNEDPFLLHLISRAHKITKRCTSQLLLYMLLVQVHCSNTTHLKRSFRVIVIKIKRFG